MRSGSSGAVTRPELRAMIETITLIKATVKLMLIGCFLHCVSYSKIPTEAEPEKDRIKNWLKLLPATQEYV